MVKRVGTLMEVMRTLLLARTAMFSMKVFLGKVKMLRMGGCVWPPEAWAQQAAAARVLA
jgi:hypothetical protein